MRRTRIKTLTEIENLKQGRIEKTENAVGNIVYVIPSKYGTFSINVILFFCTILAVSFITDAIHDGLFSVLAGVGIWIVIMWVVALVVLSHKKIEISSSALDSKYVIFGHEINDATFLLTDINKVLYDPLGSVKMKKGNFIKAISIMQTALMLEYGVFIELSDKSKVVLCEKGTKDERRWLYNDLTDVISRMRCDG